MNRVPNVRPKGRRGPLPVARRRLRGLPNERYFIIATPWDAGADLFGLPHRATQNFEDS